MVNNPDDYISPMVDAGADIITIHYESCVHVERTIQAIKNSGVKAGLSLVPTTTEDVLKYILNDLDQVLIMTVNPGFGGQSFIKSQLKKIQNVRKMIDECEKNIDLEVDGGINNETAKDVIKAGANVLVAGSYIFKASDYNVAINSLKR